MTDRELEGRLRAWFHTEFGDTEAAPADLREQVAAIPRTTPIPLRPLSGRRGMTLLAAAAVLLVGGALAAGAGFRLPSVVPPVPTPQPSRALGPTPSATEATGSPRPEASPLAGPVAPATPDMVAGIDQFMLATDDVGWVTTRSRFYRTEDMGGTWTEVRPPGWTFAAATRPVDADTMYAASDSLPMVIAATHDGGTSWVESTIDDPAISRGPTFSFQAPSKGYATFGDKAGEDKLRVYATTDGGTTWTGPLLGKVPVIEASMGKIEGPSGGVLYMVSGKYDTKPFNNAFVMSMDGGVTWKTRSFPIGDVSRKADQKQIAHIWLEDGGRIRLAITAGDNRGSIWVSDDDARSWQLVKALPAGIQPDVSDFASPTSWIFFAQDGSTVQSTADGGDHWRTITTVGPALYSIDDKSFASPDRGWVMERCRSSSHDAYCDGSTAQTVFRATTDGGRTWTRIGAPADATPATASPSISPGGAAWTSAGTIAGSAPGGRGPGSSATLLRDGRVLVAGGAHAEVSAALFDPDSGAWTSTGSLAQGRVGHTATLLTDGRVLVAGGSYDGHDRVTTELYDAATGRWSPGPSMKRQRSGHSAAALHDGRVLVVGGDNDGTVTAEVYDPALGAWTLTGTPLGARHIASPLVVLSDGRVLWAGGIDGNNHALASAELYDPSTGRWTATGTMSAPRSDLTATLLLDGRVLIIGGAHSFAGRELPSAELYDPLTDAWSSTGEMTTPRSASTATLLRDGSVLVAGGSDPIGGFKAMDTAERYDPASGTWTTTASLSTARYGQTATLLADGTVLVAGGHGTGGFNYLTSAERYRPGGPN